ncbi:hypothetical protein D9613_001668 [Agrocybe pediades]|uniref:SGT1-domain-containing protein n=1 Tax=Agrocybe pediades TaxID=84607 RepID=A0A8H4R8P3_9AGAR|nr:hypothetical protein D9613_001668 [Agrocybe pediades]
MDIFNRPQSIAEDTLHFTIYPPEELSDKASVSSFAACITSYVESLLPGFIWHRDTFEVKLAPAPEDKRWVLESRMRVGDSVDDEWCTVWLLKQISSKWDVVISVYDSDGEFLLIEAAEALPSWVKPTNSENRVWIYRSRLHLIPLTHISPPSRKRQRRKLPGANDSDNEDLEVGDDDTFIAVEDAVKIVRDPSVNTLAPAAVERIVWERISEYPEVAKTHTHVTKAYLPTDIAKALIVNPSLVQRAVETFYTRDAVQLRAAHRMTRFPPNPSVLTSVKMTRTAYAQLTGQKFFPPKVFGQWSAKEGTDEWRRRDVGMKISVGFEMLYQESKRRNNQATSTEALASSAEARKEALRRDPDYQKFIENLKSANYFKGEIQGSELWNALENKAAKSFVEVRQTDDSTRQSFAAQVDVALSNKDVPDHSDEPEQSDAWLSMDAQEFEHMLESTMGSNKTGAQKDKDAMDVDENDSAEDRVASEQAQRLKNLASKVESFVEGQGDLEGALFEDEEMSDDLLSDESESSDDSDAEPEEQTPQRTEVEKRAAMDALVPALELSDYGKMPASYHSNSQRVAKEAPPAEDTAQDTPDQKKSQPAESKEEPKKRSFREPIIPRDKYDGVDSDDETDEEQDEDSESEEDKPQVVGEIEIDMDEEEEEFLEFSRQALGITDEQWSEIIQDRKDRGAFLPESAKKPPASSKKAPEPKSEPAKKKHEPRVPEPGPRPNVNPELDNFETVMKALDEALSEARTAKQNGKADKGKGKAKQQSTSHPPMDVVEEEPVDIDAAMEAELKAALERDDSDDEQPADYKMIKNFLESFKSQEGLSGPFSNLAGRLQPDFKLPRDES